MKEIADDVKSPLPLSQPEVTPSRKRKAEDEVADSQDEDEDSEAEFQWNEALLEAGTEQEGAASQV